MEEEEMKRLLSVLITTLLLVTSLMGCGKSESTSPSTSVDSSTSKTSTASSEPVTITIWSTRSESTEPTSNHMRMLDWVKRYNESNTENITVELVGSKKDDAILTAIASGGTPDVFMGYWNTTSTWADKGALLDLTDYINNDTEFDKNDFANVGWAQATYDNKIWGVPFIMNTTLLYYRSDLLAEGGYSEPPKTLDELKEMAIALTKYDSKGDIIQAGFIPNYPWLDNVCWPVMNGAEWIDANTNTITFDSEKMRSSYQWQADICKAIGYDKITKFKDGFGKRDSKEDPIIKGKIAMTFFSELKLPAMIENGKDIKWGVCALPHGNDPATAKEAMLTTNQYKINANTKHPDQAWEVLSSLCSKEEMSTNLAKGEYDAGAFYARKSAVEAVKSLPNIHDAMITVADIMLQGTGRGFPNSAYVNEYLTAINDQMSLALSGDQTVEEACKAVVKTVQPMADKHPVTK